VERLLREDELANDAPCSMEVSQCPKCGLVQLSNYLGDDFYADYEMGCSFSPAYVHYLDDLSHSFKEAFDLSGKTLLEVGCGDGAFLDALARGGLEVSGIEPSTPFRNAAIGRGHRVQDLHMGPTQLPDGAPFEALVTRQVLEHVFDIDGFLRGINNCLVPGGALLVEVPNLTQAMDQSRFYDFFPDHVNYFDAITLASALRAYGFEIISVKPTMAAEFVTAHARKASAAPDQPSVDAASQLLDFSDLAADMVALIDDLKALCENCAAAGKRLAVWGSGGKGVAALAAADLDGITYVVDSDPRKQGLFMPASHHKIEAPEYLRQCPPDVIILTALAHKSEILDTIRGNYGFRGMVAALGRRVVMIDLASPG